MAAECWPSARRRQFACFPHDSCAVANRCCRLIEEVPAIPAGSTFLDVSASKEQRDGLLQVGFAGPRPEFAWPQLQPAEWKGNES